MKTRTFYLIASLFLTFNSSLAQVETTFTNINDPIPVFDFENSRSTKLVSTELKGKTVLIVFFATWCGPCRKELPHIQADIYNKYKNNKNFELLIFGREHSWDEVIKFKTDNKYSMPFYPDQNRSIYSKFAGQYIPRNFLFSSEGKLIFSSIGFEQKDFEELKKHLEKELKKR